jgi:hypothetical protein
MKASVLHSLRQLFYSILHTLFHLLVSDSTTPLRATWPQVRASTYPQPQTGGYVYPTRQGAEDLWVR